VFALLLDAGVIDKQATTGSLQVTASCTCRATMASRAPSLHGPVLTVY
jgi:hypothetical protein